MAPGPTLPAWVLVNVVLTTPFMVLLLNRAGEVGSNAAPVDAGIPTPPPDWPGWQCVRLLLRHVAPAHPLPPAGWLLLLAGPVGTGHARCLQGLVLVLARQPFAAVAAQPRGRCRRRTWHMACGLWRAVHILLLRRPCCSTGHSLAARAACTRAREPVRPAHSAAVRHVALRQVGRGRRSLASFRCRRCDACGAQVQVAGRPVQPVARAPAVAHGTQLYHHGVRAGGHAPSPPGRPQTGARSRAAASGAQGRCRQYCRQPRQ